MEIKNPFDLVLLYNLGGISFCSVLWSALDPNKRVEREVFFLIYWKIEKWEYGDFFFPKKHVTNLRGISFCSVLWSALDYQIKRCCSYFSNFFGIAHSSALQLSEFRKRNKFFIVLWSTLNLLTHQIPLGLWLNKKVVWLFLQWFPILHIFFWNNYLYFFATLDARSFSIYGMKENVWILHEMIIFGWLL